MEEAEAGGAEEMVGESIQTVSRQWGALFRFEFFHLCIPNRKEKNESISLLLTVFHSTPRKWPTTSPTTKGEIHILHETTQAAPKDK